MFTINKIAARLLRLFFTNPDGEYYIQEIGRIIGAKPGIFQRTLYNLEKQGVLASRYQANARYFRANRSYPLFEEIKSIIFKTFGIEGTLKEALQAAGPIDVAFIYGSFAKGNEQRLSDIDLMIIGSPDENVLLRRFGDLEGSLRREINYRIYSSLDLIRNIQEHDPFVQRVLEEPKIFLIGGDDGLRNMAKRRSGQEGGPRS